MFEDKLLLWRFKSGDRDALRRIYEKYYDDLLTIAANMLGDLSDAQDVVHDVFVSFAKVGVCIQLSGSLKGYLATSVANRVRDCFRKAKRRPSVELDEVAPIVAHQAGPVELALRTEDLLKLQAAMRELPYEQREAIVMRVHSNMRFREIAVLQNVSTKTAQSRYKYGLDKLRSILDGELKK